MAFMTCQSRLTVVKRSWSADILLSLTAPQDRFLTADLASLAPKIGPVGVIALHPPLAFC